MSLKLSYPTQSTTALLPVCQSARAATHSLRVLQIGKYYPPYRGGMETHLHALCERLKEEMHVEVLVANDGKRTCEEVVDEIKVTRVATLTKIASAPFCPGMVTKIRQSNADIVHIHLPNPTAVLAFMASGHQGRLVFTYHSDIVKQRYLSYVFDPVLRASLNKAHAIIASTENYMMTSETLSRVLNRCHVIPFGIRVEDFHEPNHAEVARLRARYGERMVLGVGRLVYYKGFEYLVRAMAKIDAHLVIVGKGPLHAHLLQIAGELGIGDRVSILDEVEDVSAYYHAASVFALPSIARSEAFGLVQLEAMACGKPVVNTDLDSGVKYVSLDKVTGLTVPPADATAMADAINLLLDNPQQAALYGQVGKQRVAEHFSLEVMTQRTIELYRQVMR